MHKIGLKSTILQKLTALVIIYRTKTNHRLYKSGTVKLYKVFIDRLREIAKPLASQTIQLSFTIESIPQSFRNYSLSNAKSEHLLSPSRNASRICRTSTATRAIASRVFFSPILETRSPRNRHAGAPRNAER